MKQLKMLQVSAIALTVAMLAPGLAAAQTSAAQSEIVVTATKRSSTVQDVPFSINAQTAEDIQRSGALTLEDLSRNVAGLAVQNLGPGQSQTSLRGVSAGQIVRDQPGVKEQVGIYLDESAVSLSLFTPDLDLYDLNRVETLRGPQGTLFGAGSVGGTIRYITNQPNLTQFEGSAEADVNTVTDGGEGGHIKGMVNLPFANGTAALRIVAYQTYFPGFIDARREGGRTDEDINDGERSGVRAALTWKPTANLTITPRVVYQEVTADGFNRQEKFNLFANPFTTTRPAVRFGEREQFLLLREEFKDETTIADLTANWDLGGMELTSVTSYTDRSILVSRDASALTGSVSVDLAFAPAAALLPSNLRDTTQLEQWTQEVRLASTGEGPLQWVVGAYYIDQTREYAQRLPTPGYDAATDARFGAGTASGASNGFPANSPYNSDVPYALEQFAVFGEASYDVTDRLTVTAGGRYYDFSEDRTFKSGGLFSNADNNRDSTSSDGFSPRVIVSYDLAEDTKLNAQVAQGFRLGGVNDPLNVPLCQGNDVATFGGGKFQTFQDEKLWNYEVGVKKATGAFSASVSAFYNDISDLQVNVDAGSCSSRVVINADSAHSTGIEAEISGRLFDSLDLSFSGSVIQAEFDSTLRDSTGAVLAGVREGNRLPTVPEYQLAASATYFQPAEWAAPGAQWYVTASVQTIGSRFTQPGDQEPGAGLFRSNLAFGGAPGTDVTALDLELEPYTLVNLSAGLDVGPWGIVGYVKNVADENANLSFDRERGGRARLGFATNQPRTYGLTVRRSF